MALTPVPRRLLAAALVCTIAPAALTACTSQGPVIGEYTYLTGNLVSHEAATLDQAWDATQAAIADLQFEVKSKIKDALDARLTAKQADGSDVEVKLARASERVTRITVRVGLLGDETRSRIIMDRIKSKL